MLNETEEKVRRLEKQAAADYEYSTFMRLLSVSVSKHLLDEHFTLIWANSFFYDLIGYSQEAVSYTHLDVYKRQALEGTIAFYGNKPSLGPKACPLGGNHSGMVGIEFRNDHGNIRSAAVGAVIGNNRALMSGVCFL